MKRIFALFLCLLLLCNMAVSCGVQEKKQYSDSSFDFFDTVTTVIGYADSRAEFDKVTTKFYEMLTTYHNFFTIYDDVDGVNNLKTVNEQKTDVKVHPEIVTFLQYCKYAFAKTDGKVNIAMGSVLSLWHEKRTEAMANPEHAALPTVESLQAASLHTDIDNLKIDTENGEITLLDKDMTLDVGAIAKGYAVELVAAELEREGVEHYLLNVGGNIRAIGGKPNGEPWTVGIENPDRKSENPYAEIVSLTGKSLVTSGSYQRFYEVNGERYHHIIDPETLMPSTYYDSVSVICDSSADADVLSTALFLLSYEDGMQLLEEYGDAEAMWVYRDGTKRYSEGFQTYIQ